jgi:membrane-bound metal-dependent hydrolase YbcI (DUF457 family)
MHAEGHAGLTFLLSAVAVAFFKLLKIDLSTIVIVSLLMVFLSSIPDLDLRLGIEHRGITHTFVFGLAVGVIIGILFGSGGDWTSAVIGFIAGFGGTVSHLLGDAFTYESLSLSNLSQTKK